METCTLCVQLTGILGESPHWQLVLNRNQNLLGKCMLVLKRHLESMPHLTPAEWDDLHSQIRTATDMLSEAFAADHFNYAFLQNQDRHVHLHIIPRYAAPRTFSGQLFTDPDYPNHYSVPGPTRLLDPNQLTMLATHLRTCLPQAPGS